MTEDKRYSYFAFISYSRKDERWARWLQNRLETYRLPSAVRKKHTEAPRRIAPVFRDKTDLVGGQLQEQLHKELDESRFLILICSANSVGSDWVDREVRHFIETGREKQIIPVVVEGGPGSSREYFPPSLQTRSEDSLLGISVTELGRTNAFLRIVATMLGLKFDELARRHRKRMIRRCAAAALCALAVLAAAGGAWWYYTPHSAYYADYVTRYEIPEGVNKLSAEQRQSLAEFYHIVTRQGKPVLLERVNAAGSLVDATLLTVGAEYPKTEFIYNDDGLIARAEQYDAQGQPVLQKTFAYNLEAGQIAIDYQQPGDSLRAMTLQGDTADYYIGGNSSYRSDIARLLNTYDDDGFLVESLYQRDNRNDPVCDANGVYGVRYEHNEAGQIVKATYLDENGQAHASRYGVAGESYTYDEQGRIVLGVTFDSEGEPVRADQGHAQLSVRYDQIGNASSTEYLDESGQLSNNTDRYARVERTYDERGQVVSERLFDADGEPAYSGDGGMYEVRYGYDALGRLISMDFYDADGQLMYDSNGEAGMRVEYDEQGRIVRQTSVDVQGELCEDFSGIAGTRVTYDEYGYVQSVTYIGADGEPCVSADGCVTLYRENDSAGNCLRAEYRDADGALMPNSNGVSAYEYTYDGAGNMTSMASFDAAGQPCAETDGCGLIRYSYENGNRVSTKVFGPDGEPISIDGHHETLVEYDDRGNAVRNTYLDEQGRLTQDGVAVIELTVDSYGNELERRYYDAQGEPIQEQAGLAYWKREQEYDERGNCVRVTYTSLTGEYADGYATALTEFDEYGNLVRQSFLDEDGAPCTDDDGASVIMNTYDEKNQLIRQEYLNMDGQPGNDYGISAIERQYDERGRLTRDVYYRPDAGTETMEYQIVYTYDEYGEIVSRDFQYSDDAAAARVPVICVEKSTDAALEDGIVPGCVVLMWNDWEYFLYDEPSEAVDDFENKRQNSELDSVLLFAASDLGDGEYGIAMHSFDREDAAQMQLTESAVDRDVIRQIAEVYQLFVERLFEIFEGTGGTE